MMTAQRPTPLEMADAPAWEPLVKFESATAIEHVPVLVPEIVSAFNFERPVVVVDGTLGLGGHSEKLLEHYPLMTIVGVEWDPAALTFARQRLLRFGERFRAIEGNYADLPDLLLTLGLHSVDGILLDLGLSSFQLRDSLRGFSFLNPGPLDMRMSPTLTVTAWDLLSRLDEQTLAQIFKQYGEEPHARRAAAALKEQLIRGSLRNDAVEIANVIRRALPSYGSKIDPATRVFQALRIAVNDELGNVQRFLVTLQSMLRPGGRAAIIAFHSLEDRPVKRFFQQAVRGCECPPQAPICVCGKKPWARLHVRRAIQASAGEIRENPRSRSARLRVLERL